MQRIRQFLPWVEDVLQPGSDEECTAETASDTEKEDVLRCWVRQTVKTVRMMCIRASTLVACRQD